ncbi:hypothetical protein AAHE18_10G137000 [Arachis hypogaea]
MALNKHVSGIDQKTCFKLTWISLGASSARNTAGLASLLSSSFGILKHTSIMQIPASSVQRSIPGFLDYPTTSDQVVLKSGVSSKEFNNQNPQTLSYLLLPLLG